MPAVRNIPYGIQQPAVSGQILQLEEYLGGPLFQRRPFQLTEPDPGTDVFRTFFDRFFMFSNVSGRFLMFSYVFRCFSSIYHGF